jgi:hypothetical protein
MMGDSEYENVTRQVAVDEVVWESLHTKLPHVFIGLGTLMRILTNPE